MGLHLARAAKAWLKLLQWQCPPINFSSFTIEVGLAVLNTLLSLNILSPKFFTQHSKNRNTFEVWPRQARLSKTFSFNPRQWKRIASFKERAAQDWNSRQRLQPQMELSHQICQFEALRWQIFCKEKRSIWPLDYMGVSLNVCKWQRE